ncbi:hypothetical protein KL864_15350 [Mycolicibacterium goodii]|uniref:allene oxide cyclase barrel-like domain-containing protein n=1 Tax=Mycolicibacterium goodii TaxID=134601 RepID=UPI000C263A85|nr:hypothetical protein [Mycolicibacterium goodii]MBU8817279.1 hypothetical protein [Mycolicibacterium goodii]PJK22565.1 hypothetical protein CSX11_08300 [Mycolicibacterium goodii]
MLDADKPPPALLFAYTDSICSVSFLQEELVTRLSKAAIIGAFTVMGLVVAGVGLWLFTGPSRTQDDSEAVTLTLDVENDQVAKHNFGNPGLDVGDMDIFSDILSIDGKHVGYDGGVCFFTNVTPDNPMTYCELTIHLDDGQIFARSLTPHTLAPFTMSITGGTGAYTNARGELTVSGVATPDEKYVLKFSK